MAKHPFTQHDSHAAIAQLGERETEDLEVAGSSPARGTSFFLRHCENPVSSSQSHHYVQH